MSYGTCHVHSSVDSLYTAGSAKGEKVNVQNLCSLFGKSDSHDSSNTKQANISGIQSGVFVDL